jgi:tyrosyl-tRNA synthetase
MCGTFTGIQFQGRAQKNDTGRWVSLNKEKIDDSESIIRENSLLNNKYLLIQKGKKNYFLLRFV